MFSKILVTLSMLFFVAACSTTNKGANGVVGKGVAGEDVAPFTIISKDGNNVVRASDRVFFAFDSAVLDASAQKTLDRQAQFLAKNTKVTTTVEGHCDERGTREYNLALGERRANAVKSYLVNSGVAATRVATISYGKERPAVVGHTEEAYSENRRAVTVPDNL
jgi:peptidoglycan-associated lipoprotein